MNDVQTHQLVDPSSLADKIAGAATAGAEFFTPYAQRLTRWGYKKWRR